MNAESFFNAQREQSEVKTAIVAKYFWAWSRIVAKRSQRVGYVDLFCGPGSYKDGSDSTPLLIIKQALQDSLLRDRLVTVFNDKDPSSITTLRAGIASIPNVSTLKYQPAVYNDPVGDEFAKQFPTKLIPSVVFLDPWGYKGLSLDLMSKLLRGWGCDLILFFNYTRINMGVRNPKVRAHMDALLGSERVELLANTIESMNPDEREMEVVEAICQAMSAIGGEFVLPFCFRNRTGTKTSHHLIFVSKSQTGYQIMKDIMARESLVGGQRVPSFMYSPATRRQRVLFEYVQPLVQLGESLLSEFAGRRLSVKQVFMDHNVGKAFILPNYQEVLMQLEDMRLLTIEPPREKRMVRKGKPTLSVKSIVTFPTGGR